MIYCAVKLYRWFCSPLLAALSVGGMGGCRFYPSCSAYWEGALRQYGLLKACWISFKRILRCHPWHAGGVDLP